MADAKNVKTAEDIKLPEGTQDMEAEESTDKSIDKNIDKNIGKSKEKKDKNVSEASHRKKRLIGSFPAKVAAFFLLAVSSFVAAGSIICVVFALATGMYEGNTPDEVFMDMGMSQIRTAAYRMRNYIQNGTEEWLIQEYLASTNCDVDILYPALAERDGSKGLIWGTYDGSYETDLKTDISLTFEAGDGSIKVGGTSVSTLEPQLYRIYVNPEFPQNDNLRQFYKGITFVYEGREIFLWSAISSCLVVFLCFIFLMRSAGHSNDREELSAESFRGLHLDVLTVGFLFGLAIITGIAFQVMDELALQYMLLGILLISVIAAVAAVWVTGFFYEAERQFKRGKWWRHTLIYIVLNFGRKLFKALFKGIAAMFRGIPLVMTTVVLYLGLCIAEFLGIGLFMRPRGGIVLWALEKLILFPVILYIAVTCKRLLRASEALAEGRQDHVVDTSLMFGDFKEHGKNLNSIGQGISKAVAERMKSEHLKTELITNVSHDIKTPLTSIINYSGLISEEKMENEKITEYAQVLLRQSDRLKKLLEDLVEASKATTGNLEVNLVPCEVGVILSQAVGEYQQKLEEKELELITTQPEEPVRIMADGRHLWRVFDNLLNNICKYAQENSRVYLNVELREKEVCIIFRNMSKYPLNMSPEELEERFVRGDKSRHMEGNGLGLSIAGSLMDLQNGRMEILTDGDLFKVTLRFKQLEG